ncbi:MAG: TolC family protein, partial [Deltaproteobacteria bacterium]|nr:TolC family protein [Deltaproteobacteria bacterium]
ATEIDVAGEVWRAYYAFETSLKKYHYGLKLLTASQSAYYSNLRGFNNGLATIVDLLSAERDLADAKYTMIQSRAEVLISAAAVAYALGAIAPKQP